MRMFLKGIEYVLAKTSVTNRSLACMAHQCSLPLLRIPGATSTPQLYMDEGKEGEKILYVAAVQGKSQIINYVKRLVPVSQLDDLIGEAL
jgi:hypothetical protein